MIETFDNFFPEHEIKTINEKLARPLWSFTGGGVSDINDFESRMWHMDGLENDEYFKTLFSKISTAFFKLRMLLLPVSTIIILL